MYLTDYTYFNIHICYEILLDEEGAVTLFVICGVCIVFWFIEIGICRSHVSKLVLD